VFQQHRYLTALCLYLCKHLTCTHTGERTACSQ